MMHIHLMNILATWRLTHMLVYETGERGPYRLLDRAREYVINQASGKSENYSAGYGKPRTITTQSGFWYEVDEAFNCRFCLSIWIGFAVAIATRQHILWGFSYSAGALMFGNLFERFEK